MPSSELITKQHLARKALIYIRQSTPHQVLTNQESLRLQYALKERACELGWSELDIEVIDTDLGMTGAAAGHRQGFKELTARVTLAEVGIILSSEVTRLSRNCSDWYPLLDLCGYKGCLIADCEGVYDPATANGRLLLGLKGTLSEMELHTLRTRMRSGLLHKAERGELALKLPTGLVRDELGRVQKDPNLEVQSRIELVFDTFLARRSVGKVLEVLNDQGLRLPRRDHFGDIIWKEPKASAISAILKNPAYAGAFVYGRNRYARELGSEGVSVSVKRLPREEWKVCVNDKYPAYLSWERFERIQAMLKDNHASYERYQTRGIPRPGKALLHGIVYCAECGHKMVVQYKGGTRYLCIYLKQQHRLPVCQNLPADPIDAWAVGAFFEALSPVELDVYARALATQQKADEQAQQAREQQLERLRYQARLAERQFNHVDPENRLVAAELERRWEAALRELRQAEQNCAQRRSDLLPLSLSPELKEAFAAIGQRLPEIWHTRVLSQPQKKALLRCLLDKVVLKRVGRDEVEARIVWRGGETTTSRLPVPVGSLADLANGKELEAQVLDLFHEGKSDLEIAEVLTAAGFRSPMLMHLSPATVQAIRLKHGLKHYQSRPRNVAEKLTIPQVAKALDVPTYWVYDRIRSGRIQLAKDTVTGRYLFPNEPWILTMLRQLRDGERQVAYCGEEHQHD